MRGPAGVRQRFRSHDGAGARHLTVEDTIGAHRRGEAANDGRRQFAYRIDDPNEVVPRQVIGDLGVVSPGRFEGGDLDRGSGAPR
jgi:hypothetical protein